MESRKGKDLSTKFSKKDEEKNVNVGTRHAVSVLEKMFKAECRATAIGSFPHLTVRGALALIKEHLPDIPVWPQLPRLSYLESMIPQFSEGIPCVKIDERERRIWIDTSTGLMNQIEKFYESYLREDLEAFAVSREYAAGFYGFIDGFSGRGGAAAAGLYAVKGHVTGPITWGLTVADEHKRASFYNEHIRDCIVKSIALKARWQVARLKAINPNIVIFVDEPYLQSIGSSAVALDRAEVGEKLDEVFEAIIAAGAIPGIHICGNSDWGLIARTKVGIINFDTYAYGESISLYPGEIREFLERGGIIAWGIVPSSPKAAEETADSLLKKLRENIARVAAHGPGEERLMEQSLITSSCGVGSLEPDVADRAISLTQEVSDILRGKKNP